MAKASVALEVGLAHGTAYVGKSVFAPVPGQPGFDDLFAKARVAPESGKLGTESSAKLQRFSKVLETQVKRTDTQYESAEDIDIGSPVRVCSG